VRRYAHEWEVGIIPGERRAERVSWFHRHWPPTRQQLGLNLGLTAHPARWTAPRRIWRVAGLQVVAAPGRTPGHLAFIGRNGVLFTGDAVTY
jgi:glyoxylase-like metal-dependent hydrolase (beta-lactamase superfamily II)